jgi:hypothetical protein
MNSEASFECFYFFKIVAIMCCETEPQSNPVPGKVEHFC